MSGIDRGDRAHELRWSDVWIVTVVAFAVRLVGMIVSQHRLPVVASDTIASYLPIARSLAVGTGFQINGSAIEASHIPPLYPLWLAMFVKATGPTPPLWLIGLGNVVLRTIACVLVYVLAQRTFGRRVALAAAALYVIDPWEAFWVGYVLKESLAIPLFLLAVVLLARARDNPRPMSFAAAGAAIGIATLARFPSGVLWIGALIVIAFSVRSIDAPRLRRFAVLAAATSGGMLVTMSPWLIRNWRVVGQPVVSTHFVGRKLYTSNGPGIEMVKSGYYSPGGINHHFIDSLNPDSRHSTQQERSLALFTLRYVLTHPAELPARLGSKLVNMWRPTFSGSSRANWVVLGFPYSVLTVLSLAGVWLAARRRELDVTTASTLAVFLCVHLVYWGEIRNRQFLTPLLYCYGGFALVAVARYLGERRSALVTARA
jgi:4-amino-4-deoxy-L-arabinose transferase-like glycosyltransferase